MFSRPELEDRQKFVSPRKLTADEMERLLDELSAHPANSFRPTSHIYELMA
jgi:hypothetical protein